MAGFDVVAVEQRAEDAYVRAAVHQLDIKWAEQLAWFLGTAFSRTFAMRLDDDISP